MFTPRLCRLLWIAALVLWLAVWLFPESNRLTRMAGVILLAAVWLVLIGLAWRRRPVRITLLGLSAAGSTVLLATTNQISQEIAVNPFLWVIPLSVYLLTFILTFESDRWYRRDVLLPLAAFMLVLCAFGLQHYIGSAVRTGLPIYIVGLFVLCMFLHGEMARLRPGPRYLTRTIEAARRATAERPAQTRSRRASDSIRVPIGLSHERERRY